MTIKLKIHTIIFNSIINIALFSIVCFLVYSIINQPYYHFLPIFETTKKVILNEPVDYIALSKLGTEAISILALIALTIIFMAFSSTYMHYFTFKIMSQNYKCKKISINDIFLQSVNWYFKRLLYILAPPIKILILSVVLILLFIYFFYQISYWAGINTILVGFVCTFVGMSLVVGFIASIFASITNFFKYFFCTNTLVSEPNINIQTAMKRSSRLAFLRFSNVILYLIYFVFSGFIIYQISLAVIYPELFNISKSSVLIYIIIFNLILYTLYSFFKTYLYMEAIIHRFDNMVIHKS